MNVNDLAFFPMKILNLFRITPFWCLLVILTSCWGQKSDVLLESEKSLLDSLKFDKSVIGAVKNLSHDTITRFYSYYYEGASTEEVAFKEGIQLKADANSASQMVDNLYVSFKSKGYFIFSAEQNYGYGPDIVAIIRSNDQFDILKIRGTNAANHNHDEKWVMELAKSIHAKFPFEIIGADQDWFEAKFIEPPTDWLAFAQELYEVCPDIVDQGSGSVEGLANEMKKTNSLYMWWD